MIKRLDELQEGEKGIIKSFNSESELKIRLMGLGFIKGSKVELKKIAPLRDPIDVKIKGYDISLRKSEARNIEIELIN
jgi:ferrous iron transport protein A